MLAAKLLTIWQFSREQAIRYACICKASVLCHTTPFISSMSTKEVVIPSATSGEKDCIEIINETLIAFLASYSGNYTLMAGQQAFSYAQIYLHNIWVSFEEAYYLR